MTAQLTLTRGLPASGKSTWAKEQLVDKNTVRVNRDNIRTELFGWEYHNGGFNNDDEKTVTRVERELIEKALAAGKHVISDNTYLGLRAIRSMVNLARQYKAPVTIKSFNVPLNECKRRNAQRGADGGRQVPDHIMDSMANMAYDENGQLKDVIITAKGEVFMK